MKGASDLGGYRVWSDAAAGVEVRFVGSGRSRDEKSAPAAVLSALGEVDLVTAWARQIHSARVLSAVAGCAGSGDALVTAQRGLALSVVTADCVPVLLADRQQARGWGVVHAGWRGLVAGVIPKAVERLRGVILSRADSVGAPAKVTVDLVAWIGPAIGVCCYEVGSEVADPVVAAAGGDSTLIEEGATGKLHLDLQGAAAWNLRAAGVREIRRLETCTRCNPDLLYSYRRQGPGGGRNVALIWAR